MAPPTHRSHVTTHVLDAARGRPAAKVPVRLERSPEVDGPQGVGGSPGPCWELLDARPTDADGRCAQLGPAHLDAGRYRLVFDTGSYFSAHGQDTFYPEVVVVFAVSDLDQHYHVPVLLSPFAYSTYRGS